MDRYEWYAQMRKDEMSRVREAKKQRILELVLSEPTIKGAAQELDLPTSVLCEKLLRYGVKHEHGERWKAAVKDYLDAGQPHQYEMPVSSFYEYIDPAERGYSTPLQK